MVRMAKKYRQTLVIVTHDIEIARYSDRIIHILDGKIDDDQPNISLLANQCTEEINQTGERMA